MGEIFISYSRHDSEMVDQFIEQLTKAGIKSWVDREDIKAGNSWRVQIVEAIDTCDAFVLMLSPNSAASKNVHKEVILAQDSARSTYVVMLEVVRLPPEIRYQLAGLQFINLPLLGFEKSAQQLITVLKPHQKKTPNAESARKQTELVIQGVDISAFDTEKQAQLLAFISSLTNAKPTQLKIANITAGSVHVFVDMPALVAFQLKTFALNSDPRFKELGIVSLKIVGDKYYINVSNGLLTTNPTTKTWMPLWLKIVLSLFLIIVIGFFYPRQSVVPIATSSPTATITETVSASLSPEPDSTLTNIPSATFTAIPTATETFTPTSTLTGVVEAESLSCRYGPSASYLYAYGLIKGNKVEVIGRAESTVGSWIYVNYGGDRPCWVNARFVQVDGDISTLALVYPQQAPLILFDHPRFPPPKDVSAQRRGNQVEIHWQGYDLALGDRESAESPIYLVEVWTCQSGKIVFTPIGAFEESVIVTDEAGCSEPSHGQVFIAHVDGYIGPVAIPWPAQ